MAGRITQSERREDGRFDILLEGEREFRIVEEIDGSPYRKARVEWYPADRSSLPEAERLRLRALIERHLDRGDRDGLRPLLAQSGLSDPQFVNLFCYAIDFIPLEKQALLNCRDVAERERILCEMLRFAIDSENAGKSGEFH